MFSFRTFLGKSCNAHVFQVAEWLSDGERPAVCLKMDESHRPVRLQKVILGFPCSSNQTEFKFDLALNYKVYGVIRTYSDQKPTLVVWIISCWFCVWCSVFNLIDAEFTNLFSVLCNKERSAAGCFCSCKRC